LGYTDVLFFNQYPVGNFGICIPNFLHLFLIALSDTPYRLPTSIRGISCMSFCNSSVDVSNFLH